MTNLLKMHGLISQNGDFHLNDTSSSSPKKSWFQISVKYGQAVGIYEEIAYFATAYTLLCKLNCGYHNLSYFH